MDLVPSLSGDFTLKQVQVVSIHSYDTPLRPEPNFYRVEFPGFKVLEFNYRVIQLNRLDWRDFLNHQNPVASALMAKMKMKREERRRVKLECLRLALTLRLNPAKMEMIAGFVNTYLDLSEDEEQWVLNQVSDLIPKEVNMEWITPWHKMGRIEGRREGHKEGRMEEALIILMRLLKRRFGLIRDEVETQVRALSLPQIEELSEAFLDFNTVDDLKQWLAEHSEGDSDQPTEPTETP